VTKAARHIVEYMRDLMLSLARGQPLPLPVTTAEHEAFVAIPEQVAAIIASGHMPDIPAGVEDI
jgi:hypothetical protein